jgi:threonine aldolase
MPLIDLRSDTVTLPTPEMRRAMADADLGDDVLGEDPTVNALEERAAELLGKEAALFVASGTMGNLVSLMAHLPRGHEAIAGRQHHFVIDEAAGHAVIVGASVRVLDERSDGTFDLAQLTAAFRDPNDYHEPPSGMVALENTNAHSMGQPLTPDYEASVAAIAHERGLPLHIDGARFFHATIALGVSPASLAAPADSVTFCLSKGLACPVGSVVVGRRQFIARARRARKLLGGGMRQAGVIAGAGIVALQDGPAGMIERLAEDHANARRLAEGLAGIPGVVSAGDIAQPEPGPLDPDRVRTNFVLFRVDADRAAFLAALRSHGVLMIEFPHHQVRAVTHYGVTERDVETTIEAARAAMAKVGASSATPAAPAGATA